MTLHPFRKDNYGNCAESTAYLRPFYGFHRLCKSLMTTAVIETQGLTKQFTEPTRWALLSTQYSTTAVADITISIKRGELFGLLGPNGAGKTTLVKLLCTLILPTSGYATVAGHPLTETGAIRSQVGLVVSDERSFYWRLSARRNLHFFFFLYGRNALARIDQGLADVDLHKYADKPFRTFSSGMKQRLAIARSLLHQPQLLFLDEPSRSLDPVATQQLHTLLQRLREQQGVTIFLTTHDLAEADKLCDRIAFMHQSRIQAIGTPHTLRQQLRPTRHYHIKTSPLETAVLQALSEHIPKQQYQDNLLTFYASENEHTLTAVLDTLRQHQITIHQITSKLPTLEELFTHFTQSK